MRKLFMIACALFVFAACGKNNGNGGENPDPEGDIYGYGKILEEVRDWLEVHYSSIEYTYRTDNSILKIDTIVWWNYNGTNVRREWKFADGKCKRPTSGFVDYWIRKDRFTYDKNNSGRLFKATKDSVIFTMENNPIVRVTVIDKTKLIPEKDWKGN